MPRPRILQPHWVSPLIRPAQWLLGLLTAKTLKELGGGARAPQGMQPISSSSAARRRLVGSQIQPYEDARMPRRPRPAEQQPVGEPKLCVQHFIEVLIRFLFLRPSGLSGNLPRQAHRGNFLAERHASMHKFSAALLNASAMTNTCLTAHSLLVLISQSNVD
jgi:hypothetical protein